MRLKRGFIHNTDVAGWGGSLLFEAQAANVSLIDSDDGVVLLEEALLLGFPPALQALHQQALRPGKIHKRTRGSNTIQSFTRNSLVAGTAEKAGESLEK